MVLAPSTVNVYECETGLRSSNNSNSGICGTSFDYTDWTDEMGKNLEKPISRSKVSEPKSERAGRKRRVYMKGFQPTDWLSSIKPHKLPFYPQVGDEVMYFRQGMFIFLVILKFIVSFLFNCRS